MKTLFTALALFFVAIILFIPLSILGFIWAIVDSIFKHRRGKKAKNVLSRFFFACALSIDQSGNVICQELLNDCLLKKGKGAYKFGDEDETISSVLGRNKQTQTLNFVGRCLAGLLDAIDKNHCIKSIGC